MTPEEFVEAIRLHVMNSAVEDVVSILERLPGRKPAAEKQRLSDWYNQLSEVDKSRVIEVIGMAAHAAVFGLLAVLDGVRTVDERKGQFELTYISEQRYQLLDPDGDQLHDLLNASLST